TASAATSSRAGERDRVPDTTPPRGSRRRRARARAGTSAFWEAGLAEIRSCSTEHLVLLLEEPDPLLELAVLGGLHRGHTGTVAGLDGGLAEPLRQRHRMDPEIGGDHLEGRAFGAVPGDSHDVVAELLGVGLGHLDILPGRPLGQASSDVTPTRGSPNRFVDLLRQTLREQE